MKFLISFADFHGTNIAMLDRRALHSRIETAL
jgi:hypothetical protein